MRELLIRWLCKLIKYLGKELIDASALDLAASIKKKLEITSRSESVRAKQLVAEAEQLKDVSGEYKRHVVYSQLIKEFPNVSKRILSMQIEKALQ